jgi:fibronectin type 3 domain-containing protein
VILSWPAPRINASESSVQSIRRIDVFRLAEKPDAPLPLTETEFSSRSTLIGSVPYDQIRAGGDTLSYVDTLELAGQPTRLRYSIRYVNSAGQGAAFSNFLLVEPAARIAEPPVVSAGEPSESAVTLVWNPPTRNIDGTTPANLLGYNIYRTTRSEPEVSPVPLNSSPVTATRFSDKTFKFGEDYQYVVRAVSLGTNGRRVESLNSNAVSVSPRDIYPPAPPGPLTIAAAPGRISIFFPQNPEPDVAGYNLYRSSNPTLPKGQWTRLNDQLLTKTTFQDENVEGGKRYYYYVTAVDNAGNVSAPSEVVSEAIP